jgi:hypothetical protein
MSTQDVPENRLPMSSKAVRWGTRNPRTDVDTALSSFSSPNQAGRGAIL